MVNEIPEPHAVLALRVIAVAILLTLGCFGSAFTCWLIPHARIWREKLEIKWRDYRRPIAKCIHCDRAFRTFKSAIKHERNGHCAVKVLRP